MAKRSACLDFLFDLGWRGQCHWLTRAAHFGSWRYGIVLLVLLVLQTLDLPIMESPKQFLGVDDGAFLILVITFLGGVLLQ